MYANQMLIIRTSNNTLFHASYVTVDFFSNKPQQRSFPKPKQSVCATVTNIINTKAINERETCFSILRLFEAEILINSVSQLC